ncbi:SLBB domain-containing protein [Rheinheimera nanhaiensis]|uniref:Polysaccharide export outer membrane protein n=1 Tax=Rheinheimera nanhaiensis E407-8 TaxID=562729 RepID=I1DWC5_9GAMM|nr:SLBB domain-containing protein [Rheinheimera nanhaiensis]GAB58353.1 polysaccharide export outer membrane protein [Rheinheimera nanhaiensis E407-8]
MLKYVKYACLALLLGSPLVAAQAVTPSPAMIEQFKKLPRAQQEQLARQYGVDLNQFSAVSQTAESQRDQVEPLTPREPSRQTEQDVSMQQQVEQKAQRFGLALFNADISTFAPVDNAPVPEGYVLGAGDTLLVQLFGKQSSDLSLSVDREGKITIPDLAPMVVGGLTFATARELIAERVSAAMIGTQAAVSMGTTRSINVFLAGEAKNPGMYAVSALTSVTQALFVAGGVSDVGSLRAIEVKRRGETVASFDLYNLLLRGDNRGDINLKHGDVVFVPPYKALAEVTGEVVRPGLYELTANEQLSDLVSMAGGLKATAHAASARLERISANNLRDIKNVDLSNNNSGNVSVKNGDVLRVDQVSNRVQNQVTLAGAVARPGMYAWRQGMQVKDLIPSLWSDLLWSADLDYALIVRQQNLRGDISVLQFNLANALNSPQPTTQLQANDTVLVFHHADNGYKRDTLNGYLREQLAPKLTALSLNATLAGDVAGRTFEQLKVEDALRTSEVQASNDEVAVSAESLLKAQLQQLLQNVLTDSSLIAYSAHLTRTELLYPVLQRLKQQSNVQHSVQLVSVSGEVKVPGEYPLTQGAGVTDLLAAAGGVNPAAFLQRAELSRYKLTNGEQNAVTVSHMPVNLAAIVEGQAAQLPLQSRDRLNIFATPDWSLARKITIQGEVRFPGVYSIQKGETLSDVLARAGGVTDDAFLYGAVFTRRNIQQREQVQHKRLLEQLKSDIATKALTASSSMTTPADAMGMIAQLENMTPVGRLVINAEQILAANPQHNLVVEDGDQLLIPRRNSAVSVLGEVQLPGTHRYDTSVNVEQYIRLAGGMRKRADEDRIYVIRADGSVYVPNRSWYSVKSDVLKPGDTIIVPLDTDYKDGLSLWAQVTQIFYQTAVAIAALNSF